jgi:dihydrofolate synthase / folylpolyglutamate synthase
LFQEASRMVPSEVHSYLNSFINFESQLHKLRPEDFSLNRIKKFLDLAGDQTRNLKIIHVAGTKGKGSTCAFLASILQEAGYKVGLYTSPHLHRVNERIRILNADNVRSKDNFSGAIDDEELASVLATLRPFAAAIQNEGNILTYFEVLTVAALCYFAKAGVDVVILETGLGGRLDATNAVDSLVAVITPVSLDHTRILGATLSQIAAEKAGIIKSSHQKVVIAPQEKEVMDVVLARCHEFGVEPVLVYPDKYEDLKPSLKGKHQILNAATALEVAAVLKTMGFKISDEAVSEGLKHVRWSGRFELLRQYPDVIVDCAHNAASAKALAQTLLDVYPHRRVILVMGVSEDKDVGAICSALKDNVAGIFLTRAGHPRAHSFTQAEAKDYFGDKPFEIIDDLPQALEKALQQANSQDVVLVTGSIFVVAQATGILISKIQV